MEQYIVKSESTIDNVGVSGAELTVEFEDKNVADDMPASYIVEVDDSSYEVEVLYPGEVITTDIDCVRPGDKDIKVTMVLDNGEYADSVTTDSIALGGSFTGMNIDSISSSGKNLTLQLTGDMTQYGNVYVDGVITIAGAAIVGSPEDRAVTIPVEDASAYVVEDGIKYADGTITLPIELNGYTFTDSVSKEDITIEDAEVESFTKESDTKGNITIKVDGTESDNEAVSVISNKLVTLSDKAVKEGEVAFTLNVATADFYPVFDYASEEGDTFEYTLILYANNGTFADELKEDMISFSDDFKDATISSIDRTSDTTAEIIFAIPSNGEKLEDASVTGTVTLSADALVNSWGSAAVECSYTRIYTSEEMGRGSDLLSFDYSAVGTLTTGDIDTIQQIVGGLGNTTIGSITTGLSIASTVFSVGKTILEMTGVIESFENKVDRRFNEITGQLQHMQLDVTEIKDTVNRMEVIQQQQNVSHYEDRVQSFMQKYAELLAIDQRVQDLLDDVETNNLEEITAIAPRPTKKLDKENENSEELKKAWDEYEKAKVLVATRQDGDLFKELDSKWLVVYSYFIKETNVILSQYDKYTTMVNNFETSAVSSQIAFRTNLQINLGITKTYLYAYYGEANLKNRQNSIVREYNTFLEATDLEKVSMTNLKAGNMYCYTNNKNYLQNSYNVHDHGDCNKTTGRIDLICYGNRKEDFVGDVDVETVYEGEGPLGASCTQKQLEEFMRRMHGRTAIEELEYAGLVPKGVAAEGEEKGYPQEYIFTFDRFVFKLPNDHLVEAYVGVVDSKNGGTIMSARSISRYSSEDVMAAHYILIGAAAAAKSGETDVWGISNLYANKIPRVGVMKLYTELYDELDKKFTARYSALPALSQIFMWSAFGFACEKMERIYDINTEIDSNDYTIATLAVRKPDEN